MLEMSTVEKLIIFFVHKAEGYITKTKLVNFLYLADLSAVKWTENQLTNLEWHYHQSGPWSKEIDRALDQLSQNEVLRIVHKGNSISFQPTANCPEVEDLQFSKGLELMLRNIQKKWRGTSADETKALLDYVSETEPIISCRTKQSSKEDTPLNLHLEYEKMIKELGVRR